MNHLKYKRWKTFVLFIIGFFCLFLMWCTNNERKQIMFELNDLKEQNQINIETQNEIYYKKIVENKINTQSLEIQNIEDKKSITALKEIKNNLEVFCEIELENNNKYIELINNSIMALEMLRSKAIFAWIKEKQVKSIIESIENLIKLNNLMIEMNRKIVAFKEAKEWELNFLINNNNSFYIQYWEMIFKNKFSYNQYDRIYQISVEKKKDLIEYNNYLKKQRTLISQDIKD